MSSLFHFDSGIANLSGSSAYNFQVANLLLSFSESNQALLSMVLDGTTRKVFAKKTPEGWGRMDSNVAVKYGNVKKMVYQPGFGKILLLTIKPEVKRTSDSFLDMDLDERIEAGCYITQELTTLDEIITALKSVNVLDIIQH